MNLIKSDRRENNVGGKGPIKEVEIKTDRERKQNKKKSGKAKKGEHREKVQSRAILTFRFFSQFVTFAC